MRWTMVNSNYKNNFNHLVFPHVTGLHLPGCHSAKQISGIRHLIVFSAAAYPKTSLRSTGDGARWLVDCVSELMVGSHYGQEREAAINTDWIYFRIHPDWKYDNADHLSVLFQLACVVQLWFVITQHSYGTERLSMKCPDDVFQKTCYLKYLITAFNYSIWPLT